MGTHVVTTRVETPLYQALVQLAQKDDRTVSYTVRKILQNCVGVEEAPGTDD